MPRQPLILPPTSCDCPQARHDHGTYLMYKRHRCRCQPCSDAMWRKNKQSVVRRQRGLCTTSVPVDRAAAHVRGLRAAGLPLSQIAESSGVSRSIVEKIHQGEVRRVYSTTEAKLLAVPAPVVPVLSRHRVDATGTRRRVHALIAVGHTLEDIAQAGGATPGALSQIASPRSTRRWVTRDTAHKVRAAYDRMWDHVPDTSTPARRSAVNAALNKAARHGWLPPLAWDDDRIDDPTYTPDVTPLRRGHIRDQAAARLDELEHLLAGGEPIDDAITRAGYTGHRAALDAARHAGRTRIIHHLTERATA